MEVASPVQNNTHQPNRVKPFVNPHWRLAAIALACVVISACAPVMEATRPTPVDLSQLAIGEKRLDVLAALGAPVATVADGNQGSCDVYKLYTHGPGRVGKGVVAAGEAVTDLADPGSHRSSLDTN
jgi:hypothetical protein